MEDAEPEEGEPSSTPPDVMPLSMPPSVDLQEPNTATDAEAPLAWAPQGEWYPSPHVEKDAVSHRRRSIAAVLLAVLLAGVAGAAIGLAVGSREPTVTGPGAFSLSPGAASSLPGGTLNAISKTLTPSVVDIDTSVEEGNGVGEAAGSGMILTSGGEVLTNNHVIEDAARISVLIYGHARPVAARVVGVDIVHDVALLQLTGVSSLPHVELGNSANLKVGVGVVAIGNALGVGGPPAVTGGAVSALDQSIIATSEVMTSSESLKGLIETDAQIQPGDSGGPLVDAAGHVVGMDTAAVSSDGGAAIGFAIPINQAIGIANNIEKGVAKNGIIVGLSAFLGVKVQSVTSGQGASATGAFVVAVVPGGPAAVAGVVAGDTITAMDGKAVTGESSSLTASLLKLRPGASARLRVVGPKGATSTVPVVLGSIPL
jgi:S1-C subfamily serine protease